jgi:2-polyprenyl-3-methyl-5-hydroxy-6-metoxy-1,4-benzoquinol methylase
MTASDRQAHWQTVYQTKGEQQVSWSQQEPEPSLSLIEEFAGGPQASIIDVGGGASRLVDALRRRGYRAITVLDLSRAALGAAKLRLGGMQRRCGGSRQISRSGKGRAHLTSGTIAPPFIS